MRSCRFVHVGLIVLAGVSLGACSAVDSTVPHRGTMNPADSRAPDAGEGSAGATAFGNGSADAMVGIPAGPVGSASENGCAPGHYVGSFNGVYNSAAWGNGSFPLSVEAVPSMGRPGLEFWLEKTSAACTDSEFCAEFTVKGGKIRGFANPFSDPTMPDAGAANPFAIAVRFEIDFAGDLDCRTGEFKGLLQNGCYDVATILYRFDGTAPAKYDRATSSFTQGAWTAKELPMMGVIFPPDSKIGGTGAWNAKLLDDSSSPVAMGAGLCD